MMDKNGIDWNENKTDLSSIVLTDAEKEACKDNLRDLTADKYEPEKLTRGQRNVLKRIARYKEEEDESAVWDLFVEFVQLVRKAIGKGNEEGVDYAEMEQLCLEYTGYDITIALAVKPKVTEEEMLEKKRRMIEMNENVGYYDLFKVRKINDCNVQIIGFIDAEKEYPIVTIPEYIGEYYVSAISLESKHIGTLKILHKRLPYNTIIYVNVIDELNCCFVKADCKRYHWVSQIGRMNYEEFQPLDYEMTGLDISELKTPVLWKYIPNYLLDGNKSIKTIEVTGNIKTVGNCAFSNCAKLKYLYFGDGVETINMDVLPKQRIPVYLAGSIKKISRQNFNFADKVFYVVKDSYSDEFLESYKRNNKNDIEIIRVAKELSYKEFTSLVKEGSASTQTGTCSYCGAKLMKNNRCSNLTCEGYK